MDAAKVTNTTGIPLALGVWLLYDAYDYNDNPNYISATTLMKPVRQILLPQRIMAYKPDLQEFIPRALGHSLHDSIEKAWKTGYVNALQRLGIPDSIIGRVIINPTKGELMQLPDAIPIYIEQRYQRMHSGRMIGGKFDMVAEGILNDFKSTSAYSWLYGDKDDDHTLQMSLYRWIDEKQDVQKVTADFGRINFIFTDWQRALARSNPKYPQSRVAEKTLKLLDVKETDNWVGKKLHVINQFRNHPEADMPECTPEELWMSEPKYKYFADPTKTDGKSTKNFDTLVEANTHRATKGVGIVKTIPGEPKRCNYCEAFHGCTQKDKYFGPG